MMAMGAMASGPASKVSMNILIFVNIGMVREIPTQLN